jgi:hypothetical protein
MTINSQPFFSAVQFGPSGPPLLLTTNVGSSYALGGEIGLRGQSPAGIRWGASYALVSTTNHTTLNQAALPTSAIDYAASVPRYVVDGNLGYTWGRVELDLQERWHRDMVSKVPVKASSA